MKIGFIGTGNITTAMVTGLCSAPSAPLQIMLSPRNAEKAAALAGRHPQVQVAPNNQAVVDGSDWVILALRPPVAREVIASLGFREHQRIISVIASLSIADLQSIVAPARDIARAEPLPPAARCASPIAICPADPEVSGLFDRIGTVIPVDNESHYNAMCSSTSVLASYFAFLDRIAAWLIDKGVPPDTAVRYVGAVARAATLETDKAEQGGFQALIEDVATPGGTNEQVLRTFTEKGWLDPIAPALDAVLDRHRGTS